MSSTGTRKPNGSGTVRNDGYTQVTAPNHPLTKGKFTFLHRVVLYDKIGAGTHPCHWCKIPVTWGIDLHTDHLDSDRSNNNPENLVPSCDPCNVGRHNREKTECPYGHGPYDGVYANGWRYCKRCKADKEQRRRDRKKGIFIEG